MADAKRPRRRSGPETLEKILLAARREFIARGSTGAKIEVIAREAGVSKQIVYYYYGSKRGLYEAVYQHTSEECINSLIKADFLSRDPIDRILLFFGTVFDLHVRMPYLLPMGFDLYFQKSTPLQSIGMRRKAIALYEKLVDDAIAKQLLDPKIDKASCYSIAMFIVRGSLVPRDQVWGYGSSDDDDEQAVQARRNNALTAIRAILMAGSVEQPLPIRRRVHKIV
jgi:AcrR family transcriptional regulator